jgi:2,3-bisphosphoglycerate-independent phosphoglycerate mutase
VLAAGGALLITADHGNAEEMLFPDGSRNTQHSTNPVPVILVAKGVRDAKDAKDAKDKERSLHDGGLRDIAPTLLELMALPIPARMTGSSLLSHEE